MRKKSLVVSILFLALPANAQLLQNNYEVKQPVNTAYAKPPIVTSDCMGGVSAGVQGQFFGLSLSSSAQSEPCNRREDAKMFEWLGEHELAVQTMKERFKGNINCQYPTEECKRRRR